MRHATSWRKRRMRVHCTWWVPFAWLGWFCERLRGWLDEWAFLDILERLGHLAILVAVVLYVVERPERRKVKQYYAWQIINSSEERRPDGGRSYAIQDLLGDGVSLAGINLIDAILPHNMDFRNADLRRGRFLGAELLGADFRRAVLSDSEFQGALLSRADFSEAHLKKTELGGADLAGATFVDANLCAARLIGARIKAVDFSRADLRRADMTGLVDWRDIRSIRLANVFGVREPPSGFLEWARAHGAVEIEDDLQWRQRIAQEGRSGAAKSVE
jgi:uncharacterized protein YjbI with pentapeptide repeats